MTEPKFTTGKDLTGTTSGRLTVLRFAYRKSGLVYWECLCACGKTAYVLTGNLKPRGTMSCGCQKRERQTIHGHTANGKTSTEYSTWHGMVRRATDPAFEGYEHVTICERWLTFKNFLDDMGLKPTSRHTIERIDSKGNYEPSNCRWATYAEQSRNTKQNRWITFRGETLCLQDWARRLGLTFASMRKRLEKWPIERALTEPKHMDRAFPIGVRLSRNLLLSQQLPLRSVSE